MAVKYSSFAAQYNAPIKINGTLPIDARTVVSTLDDLYGSKSELDNTWQYVYNGLIVAVESEQSVYMCINDAQPYLSASWKKISAPDIVISGRTVTVIEYNNDKYAVEDGNYNSGSWKPNDGAQPLPQSDNLEVGKTYLQLVLNDNNYVYIKSSDLIDLSDYYTKKDVDNKLTILDSSLKTYVDGQINIVNSSITEVSTRIADLSNYIAEQIDNINSSIEKIDTSLVQHDASLIKHELDISILNSGLAELGDQVDIINDHLDEVDSSIEDISTRLANLKMVNSVSTNTPEYLIINPSVGDVIINVDVSTSIDSDTFQNTALVTNGYIEEKLAWVEIQ